MEEKNKDILPGAWKVVVILFFVGLLNYLDRTTIVTLHESIVSTFSISEAEFGLLTSVFLWVYAFTSPFAGFIADKYGRSKVIVFSLLVWSVVTVLTGLVQNYDQLLATRALMGISEAFFIPASVAMVMDYHLGSTRSLASGITLVGTNVGAALGFVGAWIADVYSWEVAFLILGGIGVVYTPVIIPLLKDAPQEKTKGNEGSVPNLLSSFKKLILMKSFNLIFIAWGLLGIVGWVLIGWLPTFYMEQFHLSEKMAGLYGTGYIYPASIVGMILGGFIADRWTKQNPMGRILTAIVGLVVAGIGIMIAGTTEILLIAVAFFAIYSLTRVFADSNLMPIISIFLERKYRATAFGILNLGATLFGGLGIYFAGVLKDNNIGLSYIFRFTSILLIFCALLFIFVKREEAKK